MPHIYIYVYIYIYICIKYKQIYNKKELKNEKNEIDKKREHFSK